MERPGYNGKVSPFTTAVKIHVTSSITQTSVLRINKGIRMQQKQGNAVLIYRQKLLKKHNSPKTMAINIIGTFPDETVVFFISFW